MPPEPTTFGLAGLLGLVLGSFATALSHRLPRGESVAAGRSKCPACGATLRAADLVPVLSWIASRGRCRHCGTAISARYPVIELVTAAACLSAAVVAPDWNRFAILIGAAPVLVTLTVVDLEHRRVPPVLIAALLPLMLAWRWLLEPVAAEVFTALVLAAGVTAIGFIARRTLPEPVGREITIELVHLVSVAAVALPPTPLTALIGVAGAFCLAWSVHRSGRPPAAAGVAIGLWAGLLASAMASP